MTSIVEAKKKLCPLVSVITVCFNSEKYIEETIKSVKDQTYPSIEYIIIDGMSSDNTLLIIAKYKQYVSCLISEPDEGIYDAMNKGIKVANGELIILVNSDDCLTSNACEAAANTYAQQGRNDCLIHGQIRISRPPFIHSKVRSPRHYPLSFLVTTPFKHPSMFVSKSVYQKHGLYSTAVGLASDYEFMLRVIVAKVNSYYLPFVISNVKMVGISTGRKQNANLREIFVVVKSSTKSTLLAILSVSLRFVYSFFRLLI